MKITYLQFAREKGFVQKRNKSGIWVTYPDLISDVWKYLLDNLATVDDVYFFVNKAGQITEDVVEKDIRILGAKHRGKFLQLPRLSDSGSQLVKFVSDWSWDANLNILFQVSDQSLIETFYRFFPCLSTIQESNAGFLNDEDVPDMFELISEMDENSCLIGNTWDERFAAMFGRMTLLERIQTAHQQYLTHEGLLD